MEHDLKRRQIPAFGHWDYCDDLPMTQYFESALQAGLIRCHFWGEDKDLFQVAAKPAYHQPRQHHRELKKRVVDGEQQQKRQPRKPIRAPKAVDEDLYMIPPELLYEKPKRNRLLRNLLSGCLGLNCIR